VPAAYGFVFLALLQIFWIVLIVGGGMIKEPKQMSKSEQRRMNRKSMCGKIYSVLKQTKKACDQDHALAIGLVAISISRNGAMLQQTTFYNWIASYIWNGPTDLQPLQPPNTLTFKEAQNVWQMQNLIANICAIPFVMLSGKVADRISPKCFIPFTLIFQIAVMTCYCFVKFPKNWGAYACATAQAGSAMMIVVTMQSYVAKRTPKNIRGMIFAVIGVMSAIGSIIYLQLYGVLYKAYPQAPWLAFGVIAMIDFVCLVFLLVCIFMGKFGDPAAGTVDDSEMEALKGASGADLAERLVMSPKNLPD